MMKKHGIIMSLKKREEGTKVMWCRYIVMIDPDSGAILIKPDPEHQRAVSEFPRPTNWMELHHFLGLKT